MKKIALAVSCAVLSFWTSPLQATAITLQIRKVIACNADSHAVKFRGDPTTYCLSGVIADDSGIASATPYKDAPGYSGMKLVFTRQAVETLRRANAVHDQIAVVIDGEPVLHLMVMEPIESEMVISGAFDEAKIRDWIARLNAQARKGGGSGKA